MCGSVAVVDECSKMNPREMGETVLNEARATGCNLITCLTSNRCYLCTKDWIRDDCYRPLETHARDIRQRCFGSGSTDGAEGGNSEKLSPSKLSELTSSSPGPSNNSYSLLQNDNMRDDRRASMEGERFSDNSGGGGGGGSGGGGGNSGGGGGSGGIIDGNGSRPLSQTSSEMDTLGPLQPVKHREKAKLQRPLTRYLPIKSESLDLRHHIETAGHQLPLIYDVTVDTTSCSGYLSKMSKKFHHWNKRWFIFDRRRKTLSYYSDNTSRKARGVIYFQSIEEVYVDHMNTVRSPQPSLTFIVKTTSRLYHLMAPSPEAMRVWVDVVFTGAEGYHEFDHGV